MTCSFCGEAGHNRRKHHVPPVVGGGAHTRRYKRAWGKQLRAAAGARKACVECGGPAERFRCEPCATYWAARQRELREQRTVYLVTLRQIRAICTDGAPEALPRIFTLIDNALQNTGDKGECQ